MKAFARIIPNIQMQNTIDDNPDTKFHRHHDKCAEDATQKKREPHPFSIEKDDRRKADAACEDHGRMRIAAPDDLQKSIPDAAEQKRDQHIFFWMPPAFCSKEGMLLFQVLASFSLRSFAVFLRYVIASRNPPSSSISPSATASLPSMMEPTSVESSSVR